MTPHCLRRLLLSLVLIIPVLGAIPIAAEAWLAPPWIDKIALDLMLQKDLAKTGNFDPYFKQLEVVKEAAVKEEYNGKRKGMNRFLEMLETKEGGITTEAAHHIFATVVKVVPYAVLLPLKSEDKLDPEEKALVDRMKRFAASIKDQDERAALSF
ncbi:MAG: hypothetical protein NW701_14835 [Nitrospira sp.]